MYGICRVVNLAGEPVGRGIVGRFTYIILKRIIIFVYIRYVD